MLSSSSDLSQVRRLEELAFAGWPALESRDVAGWRLRFSGGYTKRANSINALGQDAQVDGKTLDGLEAAYRERHQRPVWRLTPLAPPAIADLLAAARLSPDRAQPPAGLPAPSGLRGVAGSVDPTRAVGRLDRGLLHLQPGAPGASRHHAPHAGVDRRPGGLRLRRGGGPADGHGDRRRAGRPHGPVRRAGDAAGAPPRAGAQGHREPLRLGVVGTARASPTCRSSPPTKRRCRSTPRKVSARSTTTNTSCRPRLDPQAASLNS